MTAVTQATIFSGRKHCMKQVTDALLRIDEPEMTRLWLVNGSEPLPGELQARATIVETGLPALPQICADGKARTIKKRAIVASWTRLLELANPERDLLFVEDDIVAPPDALAKLRETAYSLPAGFVSGVTRTNTGGWPFYFTDSRGQFVPVQTRILGVVQLVIAGTFCCYLRHDVLQRMRSHGYTPTADMRPALPLEGKDCHLGAWLAEQRFTVAVRGDVACEHHVLQQDGKVKVWRP